jgi:solute carrier family 25 carnitine/acylcarnitine transporter 20/29
MGLYKGVQSPLVGVSALNAVVFFAYGQAKRILGGGVSDDKLTLSQITAAGAFAGFAVSFVVHFVSCLDYVTTAFLIFL